MIGRYGAFYTYGYPAVSRLNLKPIDLITEFRGATVTGVILAGRNLRPNEIPGNPRIEIDEYLIVPLYDTCRGLFFGW